MDYFETVRLWRVPSILLPFIICMGLIVFVDVFLMNHYTISPLLKFHINQNNGNNTIILKNERDQHKGFLIKTSGCRIPDMDPFDKTIKKFLKKPRVPICNSGKPALYNSNLTHIYLMETSLKPYNINDIKKLFCCYKEISRADPKSGNSDTVIVEEQYCHEIINNHTRIFKEFIKVQCMYNNSTFYTDYFAFVPLKMNKTINKKSLPNVLIFGLDSVSRLNLHRQLPQTVNYLQLLNSIELLGYNKVADNTFPNLMPVLTGMFENELKNNCWPTTKSHFDKCPFLWQMFKQQGYTTAFGEDCSFMGIFSYQKRGFVKQPTDYGYGYFNRLVEHEIGNSHNMNVKECVGSRLVYKEFLDYIKKFIITMEMDSQPYFAFFWASSLSHDYLNQINLGDNDYLEFFRFLNDSNYLNNTMIVFMSDHGMRWGEIRQTYLGRMEERLPYVHFILPEWFQTNYKQAYHNLQVNQYRLTTPFDLHETLKSFLNLTNLQTDYLNEIQQNNGRGFNLFRPISKDRTCELAEITSHWCTCQKSFEISKNDSRIVDVANFTVYYMNDLLNMYPNCVKLRLDEILDARIMSHDEHILNGHNSTDFMIMIRTKPGDGLFEATIRKEMNHFRLMGSISRLNLYGKQSACMTDFHLKLYCYCKFI